jgi:hypothetical protein
MKTNRLPWPGLPEFSWHNIPKGGKYTKLPQHIPIVYKIIPNGRKIYQMSVKYTNIFHCKTHQNLPIFDFWFENIPSGRDLVCRYIHTYIVASSERTPNRYICEEVQFTLSEQLLLEEVRSKIAATFFSPSSYFLSWL